MKGDLSDPYHVNIAEEYYKHFICYKICKSMCGCAGGAPSISSVSAASGASATGPLTAEVLRLP